MCILSPSYDIIFIIVIKNNDNLIIKEENGSQIFLLVVSVWLFGVASLRLLITNFTVVKGVRCKLFQFTQEYNILRSYTTEFQTKDNINTTSNHTYEKEPYENNIGADQPAFLDSVININVIESMHSSLDLYFSRPILYHTSRVMRNSAFCICENKNAAQL